LRGFSQFGLTISYFESRSFGEKTARYTVKLDNVEAQIADVSK